jgi:hypothetical protein
MTFDLALLIVGAVLTAIVLVAILSPGSPGAGGLLASAQKRSRPGATWGGFFFSRHHKNR